MMTSQENTQRAFSIFLKMGLLFFCLLLHVKSSAQGWTFSITTATGNSLNDFNDIPYVQNRIDERLEEILNFPGIKGNLEDWDVLNEIVINRNLENAFSNDPNYDTGRELYAEIFTKAKEIAPEATMYLNDYVTLTLGNEAGDTQYDRLKSFLGEIVDAGAPVEFGPLVHTLRVLQASHSSGTPLPSVSKEVPASRSQASETPFPLQSTPP